MPTDAYEIQYATAAVDDLRGMRPFNRREILDGIELHLRHRPTFVSQSRIKVMAQPFLEPISSTDRRFPSLLRRRRNGPRRECSSHPHEKDDPNAGRQAVKTVIWTENASWDEVLLQAGEEDVIVMRDGRPVVLMTPFDEDDLAWYARERDPGFLESLAKAREQVQQGKTVSHENVRMELGLD